MPLFSNMLHKNISTGPRVCLLAHSLSRDSYCCSPWQNSCSAPHRLI